MIRLLPASLLLTCAMSFAHPISPAEPPQVIVISDPSPEVLQQLGSRFGHVLYDHEAQEVRVEATGKDLTWITAQNPGWRVDAEATRALQLSLSPLESLRAIPGFGCYRTVEETADTVANLVSVHPTLATSIDIGPTWRRVQNSTQGYRLQVLKLTNSLIGGDKPKMFVMSSVHAREYTPAELITRYAEELLAGYGTDANATWLLDHMEFHFLLQANPDGRKRAESGLSWRKNENSTLCSGNSAGIDLNRNFPVFWNHPNSGSSTQACSETYRGISAASEPETQAVIGYVQSIFPDTRTGDPQSETTPAAENTKGLFLDVHSYSKLVLWPWGHKATRSGNATALETLGMRLAWFNDYEPQQAIGLYATRGTTDDFAYGELGVPAYTIELGVAFFENCTTFENNTAPINLAALRYAARTLHAPYKLPAGPDARDAGIDPVSVVQGEPVTLSATIDDSRYRNPQQSSSVTLQPRTRHVIEGARYFVDALPWEDGAIGIEMVPADGVFDSSVEGVEAVIDTSTLAPGRHLVYIQGKDVAGEIGPPTAAFLDVAPGPDIFSDGLEDVSSGM
ncbi:M14 family zinc carboxypeptidase [Xanthomonadaceae bacterium XH05]|nr:M14 family zinc carboxypeptidase [Xanthomonadaceae bacterium XH05]